MTSKRSRRPPLKRLILLLGAFFLLYSLVDYVLMPAYVQQGKTTKVPNVVGMPLADALNTLQASGLDGHKAEERPDKNFPEGVVTLQNPPAGAVVKFGRGVYLTVSGGEPLVVVPSLRGRSLRDASFALERVGLRIGSFHYQVSSEFPVNTIIDQIVAEGTSVPVGSTVDVVVSQGPRQDELPVPDLVHRTLVEAERMIQQAGFKVGNITYQPDPDMLPNTIVDQYPRAGQMGAMGQAIDLVVTRKGERRVLHEN